MVKMKTMRGLYYEDTMVILREKLPEYPREFVARVNAMVLEVKFGKRKYSRIDAENVLGDIYVVNNSGIVYIAGSMIDSRNLIVFDEHQFPAIQITESWMN